MKLGIQLWSVRNEANDDFKGTVSKLKKMGYEGVEIAGIKSISYAEMAEILEQVALEAVSIHTGADDIENEETVKGFKRLGLKYAALNGLPTVPDKMDYLHKRMTELGSITRKNGLYLLYHNHGYEFKQYDGKFGLDLLYEGISPELFGAEIDTCWAACEGVDPAEYIRKYKGRCPVIHLKDYSGDHLSDAFTLKAVGSGELKVNEIINAAEYAGSEWIIVEQDYPEAGWTAMDSAAESARYILNNFNCKK